MENPLNENQKRRLRVTLEQVDELLGEALRALEGGEGSSPFSKFLPGAPPSLVEQVRLSLDRLRARMALVLQGEEVPLPGPSIPALWFFRTALLSARASLEDLSPGKMKGYGPLPPGAEVRLRRHQAQLLEILVEMDRLLESAPPVPPGEGTT